VMPGQEKSFLLYAKNGEIGFKINADLQVTTVQKGSMAEGKICIGHKVLRVNNQVIITKTQFEKAIHDHAGQGVTLTVWHDKEHVKQLQHVKRAGYEIKDIVIVWNPISQQKLGLAIKGEGSNVYVTNVPDNSVCSMYLKEGDRLLHVDGWPVIDKDTASNFLVQGFRYNNRATLQVERPITDDTRSAVSYVITAATNQDPSVIMQSDVLDIMQRQMTKLEQNNDPKIKGLYKDTNAKTNSKESIEENVKKDNKKKQVQIKSEADEKIIGQDNSAMVPFLRPVPPKNP